MRRILGLEQLGDPIARSAVTIGKFFAIHRGHQALIRATVDAARRQSATSVVLTFDRHPLEVLRPDLEFPLVAALDERLDLIEALGADVTVVLKVTRELLAQEPEAFVRDVLVGQLGAVEVLAGENFRFGRGARGDVQLLRQLGEELGFRFTNVPPVLECGEPISSSRVVACVQAGRVHEASILLGRPYAVTGTVVQGDQIGRQLGFPTANVQVPLKRLLPADGVYVVRLEHGDGEVLSGVANLGVRPTVDGRKRLLEVHLLDWSGDLYGETVRVEFLDRLREEQRFPDVQALRQQITRDVETARRWFTTGTTE